MTSKQGDISLLNHPIAQELLHSKIPARLAYIGTDGAPRAVPVWFHWNGQEIVIGSLPGIPKLKALRANPKVALTIDTEAFPAKTLMIRGTATVEMVKEVPEYAAAATRYMGEEGAKAWMSQVGGLFAGMARIVVQPEWVGLLDFETRFPNVIENAMAAAAAPA
ncbi:MAG: pyridoxamine 5'-phosphate oxidase family protein [Caldilineaceae bacterium]